MKKIVIFIFGAFAFGVWLLWPLIVSLVLGAGLPNTLSCDRIDLFAKIGDSYGSLNSLATVFAASVALWTLNTQRKQILSLEQQQFKSTAMQLVAIFYSLNPASATDQRVAILKAIVESIESLTDVGKQSIYSSVRLAPKEELICKNDPRLASINWGKMTND
jgi:hypothetical protein